MTHSRLLRRLSCVLLCVFLCSLPVSAFVIGTKEDLDSLHPSPENSDPLPAQNAAPIATNLEFFTYKNVTLTEKLGCFDPEGDMVKYRVIKNPARGSVTLAEDGSMNFTYTPYENKTGKDSFTYVVEDAKGNTSEPATVKLKIQKPRTKVCYADMQGNPAHKAAIRLAELDVLVGQRIGDTYFFQPNQTVSRQEFLSLAMDTLDMKLLSDTVSTGFTDDSAIATWAKPYVATALYEGTITGSSNEAGESVFLPGQTMTRGEAGVILNRLLQLSDVSKTSEDVPSWASQSVANLDAVGIMSKDVALCDPLTKAEAATLLSATVDLLESRDSIKNPLF